MLLLWRQGFIKSQQCLTSGNRFARLVGLPSACCRGIASSPSSGKCYFERRLLKFTVDEVFDVVADVSNYKHFVPWCKDSTMISTDANSKMMRAELLVGYGIFNQKYVSEIELTRPSTIKVFSKETKLFEFLNTEWKFTPSQTKTHCWVSDFVVSQYDHLFNIVVHQNGR